MKTTSINVYPAEAPTVAKIEIIPTSNKAREITVKKNPDQEFGKPIEPKNVETSFYQGSATRETKDGPLFPGRVKPAQHTFTGVPMPSAASGHTPV